MDTQGIFRFARRQMKGAAYSNFHFCFLYLSVMQICIYFGPIVLGVLQVLGVEEKPKL